MIKLTKINGDVCYLNPGLFEMIEAVPDTLLTMANGRKYYVRESAAQVAERVEAYRARVLARARAHGRGRPPRAPPPERPTRARSTSGRWPS